MRDDGSGWWQPTGALAKIPFDRLVRQVRALEANQERCRRYVARHGGQRFARRRALSISCSRHAKQQFAADRLTLPEKGPRSRSKQQGRGAGSRYKIGR